MEHMIKAATSITSSTHWAQLFLPETVQLSLWTLKSRKLKESCIIMTPENLSLDPGILCCLCCDGADPVESSLVSNSNNSGRKTVTNEPAQAH